MIQLPKLTLSSFSNQAIDIIKLYYSFSNSDDILSSWTPRNNPGVVEGVPAWIAIEDFRNQLMRPQVTSVSKTFLSSGTTDNDRARSEFSELGLELYKFSALLGFSAMLTAEKIANPLLLSVIPSAEQWPESSLAQMLSWISEYWDFQYVTDEDFQSCTELTNERPTIFFTTGFQLVHLLDTTPQLILPSNFFLLETGGTKGKSRSLSKDELYQLVEDKWGLTLQQILSEYGMSELACQAYYSDASREFFQFPGHVKLSVQTSLTNFSGEGIGNLTIYDPFRADIPGAIRTQDVCQLKSNGEFKILGRAESSPLKGCSLSFEELISSNRFIDLNTRNTKESLTKQAVKTNLAELILLTFHQFLHQRETKQLLSEEFQSNYLGKLIINDLKHSIQNLDADFEKALHTSVGGDFIAQNWVIIPPSTHSVAAFYPTVFLLALGCNVSLRLPSNSAAAETLKYFVEIMNRLTPMTFETLPCDWRIEHSTLNDHAYLVFAATETIATFKSRVQNKMVGFGSTLSFSVVESKNYLEKAMQDLFSLRRLGCMSSRSLFFHDSIPIKLVFDTLKNWLKQTDITPSDLEKAGMFSDSLKMLRNGWDVEEDSGVCLAHSSLKKIKVEDAVASSKFVIPAISYHNREELREWITKECERAKDSFFVFSGFKHEEGDPMSLNVDFKKLGTLNSFQWNGMHCGKPLLKINL